MMMMVVLQTRERPSGERGVGGDRGASCRGAE